jgi:MoaA/NifB/PqqE/SkfB family radical SAM enzyme
MGAKIGAMRLEETRKGTPPSIGPQSMGIVLTNACNLNCITCWSYSPLRRERPSTEWMRRRLTRNTLQSLFEDAAVLSTERVIFTGGGDPLAHPEFYEIVTDAKTCGLKVTLISNLTLVRDPDRFLSLGIDTLLANFSCADAESYVAFHPNRTAADFDRLRETLRGVAQTSTELKLVFVVCTVNADVLPVVLNVAGELKASIQFKVMSATPDTLPLVMTEDQRCRLLGMEEDLRRRAEETQVAVNWDAFHAELSGSAPTRFPIEETGCYAGHYYSRVTASGDVYFCCNQHPELRIGSLHEAAFRDLWHSARYETVRARLREGGFVPGCEQCGKFDLNRKVWQQLRTTP